MLPLNELEKLRADAMSALGGGDAAKYFEIVEVHLPELIAELRAWREGGLTEEILRRQDGCLKLGCRVVVVLEDDWRKAFQEA